MELNGKTATGVAGPEDVVAALGAGQRPPVGRDHASVRRLGRRITVMSRGATAVMKKAVLTFAVR